MGADDDETGDEGEDGDDDEGGFFFPHAGDWAPPPLWGWFVMVMGVRMCESITRIGYITSQG